MLAFWKNYFIRDRASDREYSKSDITWSTEYYIQHIILFFLHYCSNFLMLLATAIIILPLYLYYMIV